VAPRRRRFENSDIDHLALDGAHGLHGAPALAIEIGELHQIVGHIDVAGARADRRHVVGIEDTEVGE
jgi:hypothetical protein